MQNYFDTKTQTTFTSLKTIILSHFKYPILLFKNLLAVIQNIYSKYFCKKFERFKQLIL